MSFRTDLLFIGFIFFTEFNLPSFFISASFWKTVCRIWPVWCSVWCRRRRWTKSTRRRCGRRRRRRRRRWRRRRRRRDARRRCTTSRGATVKRVSTPRPALFRTYRCLFYRVFLLLPSFSRVLKNFFCYSSLIEFRNF